MKLEKEMYVRTKWGYICKIININDFREPSMKYGVEASYLKDIMFIGDNDISKASHNIIDLIEVGDYVNGVMVESMNNSIKPKPIPQYKNEYGEYVDFDESDIKSVSTKEQFESMSYKIER